jgi:probable phosphoglycerate mutase
VFLIRHAETEWSASGRHTGRTDVPLTDAGRRAARRLGELLASERFGSVLTSPLSRASDTCALAGLGDAAQERPELLEWDYGAYEGLTTTQIRERRPGWCLWRDGCPGGERADDVAARVDPLVAELDGRETDAAVFSHGHVLRVLAARWLGLTGADGALFALSTASISVLGHERETRVIWRWNQTA